MKIWWMVLTSPVEQGLGDDGFRSKGTSPWASVEAAQRDQVAQEGEGSGERHG